MKKNMAIFLLFVLVSLCATAQAMKPTTKKIAVESRKDAFLYMTEVYKTDNWAEYYCIYEESKHTFDVEEAEKIMYEFFSNYKRDHGYSSVEVEDLKGASTGAKKTKMQKRIIFRHVNRR